MIKTTTLPDIRTISSSHPDAELMEQLTLHLIAISTKTINHQSNIQQQQQPFETLSFSLTSLNDHIIVYII